MESTLISEELNNKFKKHNKKRKALGDQLKAVLSQHQERSEKLSKKHRKLWKKLHKETKLSDDDTNYRLDTKTREVSILVSQGPLETLSELAAAMERG